MRRYYQNPKFIFWLVLGVVLLAGVGQILWIVFQPTDASPLIINEFVAANKSGLTDEDGDASDWIEIYNRGSSPVNLAGWALSDDPNALQKWAFPDMSLDAGDYLLVFASGKDRRTVGPKANLHTNFRLNRAGEFLALYNILDGYQIEAGASAFPQQFSDIAYGYYARGLAYHYFANPTPGQSNDQTETWAGLVEPVNFSVERGFYNAPFTLQLTTTTPDVTIRYTTDGSQPAAINGLDYTHPIEIETTSIIRAIALKENYLPSYTNTQSYIFPSDVLVQPANPPGFPTTWGTHTRDYPGFPQTNTTGRPVAADYEMDPEIVNDPRYRDKVADALTAIPTLSIVTEIQHFSDLYSNPRERGAAWERPASVEFIYPDNSQMDTQVNAGFRIQGGWGRWEIMPKHSFRLFFKDEYGPAKFKHPLFPNSPVDEFNTLVLRAGAHRSYAGKLSEDRDSYLHRTTYTEDEWLRTSQIAIDGVGSRGIFVHLYINGLYWGLYNVVERPDTSFMSSYFGGDEADWMAMNPHGPVNESRDISGWLEQELIKISQLEADQGYQAIQRLVDTRQLADYIILHWYAGIHDWPENNWYAGMRWPNGQLRYFAWDGEIIWLDGANIYLGKGNNEVKRLFTAFMQYPDFKIEFADRLYALLFNDGPLSDANSQARWLALNRPLEQAIIAESARWGDARFEPPLTQADWLQARDGVLTQMDGNGLKLIAQTREAGYYPPINPPEFNRRGGLVESNFQLTMSAPVGVIYYTTDGSDPRVWGGGEISPSAKSYATPLVITATTRLKARVLDGNIWSALHEASFIAVPANQKLQFTEIMYNPPGGNEYEFLELTNTGAGPVDLSAMAFEGIDFSFPANTILNPGEAIVLVSNSEKFAEKHPGITIGGVYSGRLANNGEKIALKDTQGREITSVTYDDDNGWPLTPDGRGGSLVLIGLEADPNNPKSWQASLEADGSPGS